MHWRPCPQTDTGIIQPGDFVAIKRIHRNSGGRRFRFPSSRQEVEEAGKGAWVRNSAVPSFLLLSSSLQRGFLLLHDTASRHVPKPAVCMFTC